MSRPFQHTNILDQVSTAQYGVHRDVFLAYTIHVTPSRVGSCHALKAYASSDVSKSGINQKKKKKGLERQAVLLFTEETRCYLEPHETEPRRGTSIRNLETIIMYWYEVCHINTTYRFDYLCMCFSLPTPSMLLRAPVHHSPAPPVPRKGVGEWEKVSVSMYA